MNLMVSKTPSRRYFIRFTIWVALLAILWCVAVGVEIWRFGSVDHAVNSDCIIVLGAAVRGSKPSSVFEERIRHGIHLYQSGSAPKLLLTGGFGEGEKHSESGVGASVARLAGVPESAILTEDQSRTTRQNLSEALRLMKANGLRSAILVSDPLHMKRASMMAEDLGIKVASSPTPSSRYRSLKTQAAFLMREIYFVNHYLILHE